MKKENLASRAWKELQRGAPVQGVARRIRRNGRAALERLAGIAGCCKRRCARL